MRKIFIILCFCLFSLGCKQNAVILPDGNMIKVEIAKTQAQAERGLMFRESLPEDSGMLFIFPKDKIQSFWMKNTLIDLDIIFIDSQGAIVNIAENMPHSYIGAPEEEVAQAFGWGQYVLEINGGLAQKHNLKPGDRLILKIK